MLQFSSYELIIQKEYHIIFLYSIHSYIFTNNIAIEMFLLYFSLELNKSC